MNERVLDDGDEDLEKARLRLCLCELKFCILALDGVESLCEEVADELKMLLGWRRSHGCGVYGRRRGVRLARGIDREGV